ncbi:MAG: putative immunity protein [Aristaeellaceae bacterium]
MPRLRRMLGSAEHPTVLALMRQMETQSHATLTRWATEQAEALALPLYQRTYPQDTRLVDALAAVRRFLAGEVTASRLALLLKAAQQAARDATDPIAQAAARAVATACGASRTPTSALGFTFYCAAAVAYDRAGVSASAAVHDALADEVFAQLLDSLQAASVPEEAHPARLSWGC